MNSFRGLANVQQTTLAAVAPGIAEALVTTAVGLVAAIPAVVAYNRFNSRVEQLLTSYETFAEEFSSILHRQVHSAACKRCRTEPGRSLIVARMAGRHKPMSEINMVPFIDIMMVMLVAFMVSSPMFTQGVHVELPKTDSKPVEIPPGEEPLIVAIKPDGTYYLSLESTG